MGYNTPHGSSLVTKIVPPTLYQDVRAQNVIHSEDEHGILKNDTKGFRVNQKVQTATSPHPTGLRFIPRFQHAKADRLLHCTIYLTPPPTVVHDGYLQPSKSADDTKQTTLEFNLFIGMQSTALGVPPAASLLRAQYETLLTAA
uniref:Uncharacterized protein n=1 Tax=Timema cristinae TaxID=61476 RepID=A0A7R9GRP1_TIMCR|nr:unnamed protein product [Timema cristinae]